MTATPNKSILQKISDIDFSKSGAHVALVDAAANGKDTPLIIKKLEPIDKGLFHQGDDESDSNVAVSMSLEDVLVLVFGAWGDEARLIANSIVKSMDNPEDAIRLKDSLIGGLSLNGSSGAATNVVSPQPLVVKSNEPKEEENTMDSKEFMKSEEGQEILKAAVDLARAEDTKSIDSLTGRVESFEKSEDARQDVKFGVMAAEYEVLGATEDSAAIFKEMSKVEGFDSVLGMLNKALDTNKNAELLGEEGENGAAKVAGDSAAELETLALKKVADAKEAGESLTIQKARVEVARANKHLVL